jgi:phospholipase C
VYVDPGMPFSITGMIHTPRLAKQFATHFSTLDDFFADTDQGRLAAYSFIEPNLLHAHNDYHPAYNAIVPGLSADPPSSILGGETARSHLFRHPHLLHGGWVQLRQHAVPGQLRRAWRHL